jgi:RNA polymerase sigma factor (TIGR02999 family)
LLAAWTGGDREALGALITRTYGELRRLARRYLRRERANHTLQATGLLHEIYLRLVQSPPTAVRDRSHFCGIAAHLMREILVEHARKHATQRRGGTEIRISLDEAARLPAPQAVDLLELDDALDHLAEKRARQAQIVELRYFAGLSIEEAAGVMRLSARTVKRDWYLARAWLYREMTDGKRKVHGPVGADRADF